MKDYYKADSTHRDTARVTNGQKVKATQVSISRLMDKQSRLHIYNGICFSLKKEGDSDMCSNTDGP